MRPALRHLHLAVLPLSLLLCGCPYESPEPLVPPEAGSLDERLFGNWTCRLGEDEKDAHVTFLAFDSHQYVLMWQQKGEEPAVLRAHAAEVEGVPFLNFQVPDPPEHPEERTWSFARYAFDGGRLRFQAVSGETLPKALAPAELRAAVVKRVTDSTLYEPLAECRRERDSR